MTRTAVLIRLVAILVALLSAAMAILTADNTSTDASRQYDECPAEEVTR